MRGLIPASRRRRHDATRIVALVAMLSATLGFASVATPVAASTGVSVVATGAVQRGPGSADSFDVTAIADGSGAVSGRARIQFAGGTSASGDVICLSVTGSSIVVGAVQPGFGGAMTTWFTVFLTDTGSSGTADTVAFDGPTNMAVPDCTEAGPAQDALWYGQVTILDGPSEHGTVSGGGTTDMGGGSMRTFDFAATRDASGAVSGTFSFSESQGFTLSGTILCLDIRGERAMVIGRGPNTGGGGNLYWYTAFFIEDGGPDGAGDGMSVNGYRGEEPFGCLAAEEYPASPLASGDIAVNGGGVEPTEEPSQTPPVGTISITSLREQGGTLAGVSYRITGTNGFDQTVVDDGPGDQRPESGIIGVSILDVGQQYTVCPATIPTDWYAQQGCTLAQLQGSPPMAGLAFDYRFIVPLSIDASSSAPASVPRLGRFEKTFRLSRFYHLRTHDPDVIEVSATFTAPSGAQTVVPAWFGTDYTLRPGTGIGGAEFYDPVPIVPPAPGVWHVRFSPDEVGTYTYTLRAQDKESPAQATVVSAPLSFDVAPSAARGQVERDPRDDRFLRYADGTPYLPMGHNVAFGDGNPFNDGSHFFEPHFASMAEAGQNWVRVWMTDFYITAIEWSTGHWSGQYRGVGQYADIPAFRIEQVLDLAEEYGLEVQLVLNDHGQFSDWVNARWSENPYSSARGGPVPASDPAAFFTHPTARELFRQRLRYLVARYAAYRDILAWELFNEVQFVGSSTKNPYSSAQVRSDIVAWHAEMAAYLRSIDPYDHLITTSSDIESSMTAIWHDPNIDLVQVHDYGSITGRSDRFRDYAVDLNVTYGKPVIIGEYGLSGEPELEFDPTTSTLPADRVAHLAQASHLHDSMWSSAMSASGAMSWWWGGYIRDSTTRHRVGPEFPANERHNPSLAAFFAGEDLAGMGLDASAVTPAPSVLAIGLDNGSRGYLWVRDALHAYGSGAFPGDVAERTIAGASVDLAGFVDGTYLVDVYDTYAVGGPIDTVVGTAAGGTLAITLPGFQRDVALKIRPGGPSPTETLPPGGTLITDPGSGPTEAEPITTSVTTPTGGTVAISSSPSTDPPAAGYGLVGLAIDIDAPSATATDPLVLVFRIDASAVPAGDDAATIAVFRNGTAIGACTGPEATATPDPCVSLRRTLGDGDVELTVRTSAASRWSAGVPGPTLGAVSTPTAPVRIGQLLSASAPVFDAGSVSGHTAIWDWGDGTTSAGTVTAAGTGSGTASGSHAYGTSGLFVAAVTITDPSGQVASRSSRTIVVYDPSTTASGSGSIVPGSATSEPGDALPALDGTSKAAIEANVKYRKGAATPNGPVVIRYGGGAFDFDATTLDWLVGLGADRVAIAGAGNVRGRAGSHPFRLDLLDGDRSSPKAADRWILRVWNPGDDPAAVPATFQASGDVQGQFKISR